MPWSSAQIAQPDEIRVAPDRGDGTPGPSVIVWAVEQGGDLFARSARGPEGAWYRRALASGRGRIIVGGIEHEVEFVDVGDSGAADHEAIDAAYRAKYRRYGRTADSVTGDNAHRVTVRISPIDQESR
jgi:hypothetical protein